MKATGNLRLKRGIWQMVFEYQDATGQRRQKSESTSLVEKGNKRRAQKMLDERLDEMEQQYTAALEARNVLFLTFMRSWLDDVMAYKVKENTLSQYNLVYNGYIVKYKPLHGIKLPDVTPALIQSYYNAQLKAGLSSNTVRKHHANIHKRLASAVARSVGFAGARWTSPLAPSPCAISPWLTTGRFCTRTAPKRPPSTRISSPIISSVC